MSKKLPVIGSIVSSSEFAFGMHGEARFENIEIKIIWVDGVTSSYTPQIGYTDEEKVAYAIKHGKLPQGLKTIELGAYDSSRTQARYVVEEVQIEDSIQGYPNWKNPIITVIARELAKDGKYDENGTLIAFRYNDPDRSDTIQNLNIEGRMKRIFI